MKLPRDIGPIHFVGIGGIGMSGIAEVLANLGYTVHRIGCRPKTPTSSGCATKASRSRSAMPPTMFDGADVLVVSSAIKRDNPELVAARARRLPVVRRAEMLAELMRLKALRRDRRHPRQDHHDVAGRGAARCRPISIRPSSMAASSMPTAPMRGSVPANGWWSRPTSPTAPSSSCRPTSPSSPMSIPSTSTISRPLRPSQAAFQSFVENVPFYGFAVMCTDHPVVQTLVGRIEDRRIVTYGENPQADVRLVGLDHADGASRFSVMFRDRAGDDAHAIEDLVLPMPGRHNALERHGGDRGRA